MFFIWSSGKRRRAHKLKENQYVVYVYSSFRLFFVFSSVSKGQYYLIGKDRTKDKEISLDEANKLCGDKLPQNTWWERYGLAVFVGAIGILVIFGVLSSLISNPYLY
ncbi:hypothetical protein HYX70_02075 [Candidatus Saccharibacteria bacterium]|nr:hypothetical protein [Candidatus Saccharibacteria bacterium]